MSKIDTSAIEGFDTMTPEQKIAALQDYEFDTSGYVRKEVFDKTASEAAEWKRKHKALLVAEGQKETETQQIMEDLKKELDEMKKEKVLSGYKSNFITQGYSEALANEAAVAMAAGEMDKVFATQKKFLEQYKKDVTAEAMKKTPKPPAGGSEGDMTKAKFLKLTTKEQMEYIKDNPNWKSSLK